ncbi:MAG TPA: glycerophosphodiester phosphodiesterase family protein [Gemmatimonadaceae bacterium]
MRAFELALEEGADALELDVHATADGIPVVIHDPSLVRTTGIPGIVAALSLDQIREADAGAQFSTDGGQTFPWRGQGIRVPTLAEVLAAFPDVPCIVEIKSRAASEAVRRTILEQGAADRCIMMSFDAAALEPFREPPWLTGASNDDAQRLLVRALTGRSIGDVGYVLLSLPEYYRGWPIPLGLVAAAARRKGRPVHVWQVDSAERARRLWRKGVAGIVTNYPSEIRTARDAG